MARCDLPVLVGPRTAVTPRARPAGEGRATAIVNAFGRRCGRPSRSDTGPLPPLAGDGCANSATSPGFWPLPAGSPNAPRRNSCQNLADGAVGPRAGDNDRTRSERKSDESERPAIRRRSHRRRQSPASRDSARHACSLALYVPGTNHGGTPCSSDRGSPQRLLALSPAPQAGAPRPSAPAQKTLRIVPFADLQVIDPINTTAGNVQSTPCTSTTSSSGGTRSRRRSRRWSTPGR